MSHLILKGVLAGLIGLTLYNTYCIFKPEIVTYDKQKIVGQFVEQLSHVTLDDQRLKENHPIHPELAAVFKGLLRKASRGCLKPK